VIPVYLDDTKFVGIPQETVGIKFTYNEAEPGWRNRADTEIVFKLIEKLS
jgi:hypothetical protein